MMNTSKDACASGGILKIDKKKRPSSEEFNYTLGCT